MRHEEDHRTAQELSWDAGDMGCGELIVRLKLILRDELSAGGVLRLTATDPGARADLPSWCRLTGHTLVHADHPHYVIRHRQPPPEENLP